MLIVLVGLAPASAHGIPHPLQLERLNRRLSGQVLDFTHNHGRDRRIWSEALHQKRDMYVYLPPKYDPNKRYPIIFWLHGFAQDEHSFLEYAVEPLDRAMAYGQAPAGDRGRPGRQPVRPRRPHLPQPRQFLRQQQGRQLRGLS